jgi:YHS domain-containing protein
MKIMCNFCGKILDLMASTSMAAEEGGQLKTYHFCSKEHLTEFARKKGMPLGKD